MRRCTAVILLVIVAGVSTLLLLAGARCARATHGHALSLAWRRCHRHEAVNHLPLWQVVTTSLLPAVAAAVGRIWRRGFGRQLLRLLLGPALAFASAAAPAVAPAVLPATPLSRALADGLSGASPTFG